MTPKARHDQLFVQKVGDELVIYDRQRHRVHRLNRTAALIWRHCDGNTDPPAMAALLRREAEIPADEDLVHLALANLRRARLLHGDAPDEAKVVTRRQVIRKLGLVGALTLLLPTVSSITAPTPAMAQSLALAACTTPINGPCDLMNGLCTVPSFCDDSTTRKPGGQQDCPKGCVCCVPK